MKGSCGKFFLAGSGKASEKTKSLAVCFCKLLLKRCAAFRFFGSASLPTVSFVRKLLVGFILVTIFSSSTQAASTTSRYLPAEKNQPVAPLKITALDFLLPGYGTFMQNKTSYAAVYFSSNIVNLGLIYIAYRNWRFYESAYQAAAVRQAIEPDKLLFQDPTGGGDFLSLQDIKNRAERGQLFFAVSVVANIALRFFSAAHTWALADDARTESGPRYEFYPEPSGGMRAQGAYYFYF